MMSDKDKRVLADIRRRTDYYTAERKRKNVSEKQRGLEEF